MKASCLSSTLAPSIAIAIALSLGGGHRLFAQSTTVTSPQVPAQGSASPGANQHIAEPVEVAADALVVRPAGLAATAVGAAIFVVALPFAAIAGDVDRTARALVGAPARFTFKRKLGDFENQGL